MIKPYAKLRGKILEKFGNDGSFAKALGVNRATLSLKLSGKSDFTSSEIKKSCELLGISDEELCIYFFAANAARMQ